MNRDTLSRQSFYAIHMQWDDTLDQVRKEQMEDPELSILLGRLCEFAMDTKILIRRVVNHR